MKNIESPENINERRVSISFLVELPRLSQTPLPGRVALMKRMF
jgi:hypothetical protein